MNWNTHTIALGGTRYPYFYGHECMGRIIDSIAGYDADRFIVVTDDNVLALHGESLLPRLGEHAPVQVLSLPAGDGMKALPNLAAHLEQAIASGATRRSVVIAFGGGVPGNLAGVVAALLFRGVRLVHIPTTTVAAMDSVISLKQAINSGSGKNHIGTYHTPEAVYLDVALLRTLEGKQLRSGLCEATKNCLAIRPQSISDLRRVLADGDLASPSTLLWLLEESLEAKISVTERDRYEQKAGLILEYGHTVGHAVEICDQRLRGAEGISHGEAVMFGMLAAARISAAVGGLTQDDVSMHDELAYALGAPVTVPDGLSIADVVNAVRLDNKRGYLPVSAGEAAMVVLDELGKPMGSRDLPLVPVPMDLVEETVAGLRVDRHGLSLQH
ncbi:2-deoxy-scyllo-inosose synthase [Streptomyces sp. HSG2]|uniref:2-deoxy-scyllo-inosose synthase n=1 Tax=Streptomyces sp. HSG2 TaxID=2797167 RepID=UPI001902D4B8|nr:2-deoxy-scyllo-inosose synthase [Streptomyces sp. HSG2]